MRRLSTLAALLALAQLSSALAEDAPPSQPNVPAMPAMPPGVPAPTGPLANLPTVIPKLPGANPEPPPDLKPDLAAAWNVGYQFFDALVTHDVDRLVSNTRAPFSFEGKAVATPEEERKRWSAIFAELGRAQLTLYGVDVYSYDDMVKKYGKPPAKLADFNWKGAAVAVANLNGRATLALLRKDPMGMWRVYGFSD